MRRANLVLLAGYKQFGTFKGFGKAKRRISKEQRAVRSIDKIVWTVEPLALITVSENGLRAIFLVMHDAMIAVLVNRESSLRIERQAIRTRLAVLGNVGTMISFRIGAEDDFRRRNRGPEREEMA